MPRRTEQFLSYLRKSRYNAIPLKNLWEITFSPEVQAPVNQVQSNNNGFGESNLVTSINNVLDIYESTNGVNRRRFPLRTDLLNIEGDGDINGISFLAQKISLPTDAFNVTYSNNTSMGGFKPGYIGDTREAYTTIDIDFIETYWDIFEYFLRPWAIAASYKGLIEDGDDSTNIKGKMFVTLYDRQGPLSDIVDTWEVRKQYVFRGVVPASVPGEVLSYSSSEASNVVRTASFAFKDYYVVKV